MLLIKTPRRRPSFPVEPGDFAPKITHEKVEGSLTLVTNVSVGRIKFIEGAETVDDERIALPLFVHLGYWKWSG
jgi:hypothetical protein